jgi:outer membrane protein TolC
MIDALEAKLNAIQAGNGLTADEAARRTLLNNPDVTAKQKSVAAAEATVDATRANFYPQLGLQASRRSILEWVVRSPTLSRSCRTTTTCAPP